MAAVVVFHETKFKAYAIEVSEANPEYITNCFTIKLVQNGNKEMKYIYIYIKMMKIMIKVSKLVELELF